MGNLSALRSSYRLVREEAISLYKSYILKRPDLLARLHELKGKRLGCNCRPASCHGDVLLELIRDLMK